jgi:hypothetical protein
MLYEVHDIDLERIQTYRSLKRMKATVRSWFNWMLEHGQSVICVGKTVYRIKEATT